jgi:hypothetical protein
MARPGIVEMPMPGSARASQLPPGSLRFFRQIVESALHLADDGVAVRHVQQYHHILQVEDSTR